jgi:transposase
MAGGRPKKSLVLTDEERGQLERWARRPKTSQRLALRSRIVLACAEGEDNTVVAETLAVCTATVGKWRKRFLDKRLDGLVDESRPGAPRTITDDDVERVVTMTLETKPKNATHWSTRSMAEATGMSQTAICRIWHAFGLQPHRTKTFKLSEDPLFVEKVRDVVGLYMNPPEHAIVLSIDEKSQVQALDRTQPLLPMEPWQVERHTHDYARHGTTSLFAALNTKTGEVIGRCHQRHRHQEFLRFLKHVDQTIKKSRKTQVHLIMDNYATHKTPAVQRWLTRHPEYHVHFTPTSASWLNQVERFFAEITTKCIRRSAHRSVTALKNAIMNYLDEHNRNPKPFTWVADADVILERVKNVCARISNSGH